MQSEYKEKQEDAKGPGRVVPYMGYIGMCAVVKGMVFKHFTLG